MTRRRRRPRSSPCELLDETALARDLEEMARESVALVAEPLTRAALLAELGEALERDLAEMAEAAALRALPTCRYPTDRAPGRRLQ